METVHDIKQLTVIGYLREILPDALTPPSLKNGTSDDEVIDSTPSLQALNTPSFGTMSHSEFEQKMMEFHGHLGVPALGMNPTSQSEHELSMASHLSDHELPKSPSLQSTFSGGSQITFSIPTRIIQYIYFYYHRHQNYLLLLGGSEECKDNSLNQVQILNVQNSSDIAQEIEYSMSNHRLQLHVWRENVVMVRHSLISHHLFLESDLGAALGADLGAAVGADLGADSGKEHVPPSPRLHIQQSSTDSFTDPANVHDTHSPSDKGGDIPLFQPQNAQSSSCSPNGTPQTQTKQTSPFAEVDGDHDSVDSNNSPRNAKLSPKAKSAHVSKAKTAKARKSRKSKVSKKRDSKSRSKTEIKTERRASTKRKSKAALLAANSMPKQGRKSITKKKAGKNKKGKAKRHKTMMVPSKSKGKSKNKNPITGDWHFDRYDFGQCLMALPRHSRRWPWFKGKYEEETHDMDDMFEFNKYKAFIRCGGIYSKDDEYSNENDLILFNATNLNEGESTGSVVDAFHLKLPAFKERLRAPAVCYNGMDHVLSFGGYSYSSGKAIKNIFALNLNAKRGKMKWKKYGCSLLKPRLEAAATHFIGSDRVHRVLIMGGKGSNEKPLDTVEVFDSSKTSKSSKCVQLKEMNFKRSRPGSCLLDGFNGHRFAVCGGIMYGKGTNTVELYDLEKDIWTVHSAELQYEHLHPTMWTLDVINPNILYVAGNSVRFGAKKGSVGFVEYTDLRMKAKQFELLYNEPLDDFYTIEATRGNLWEPRSLLHFSL